METKNITLGSNSVAFGLLTAFALIAFSMFLLLMGLNQSPLGWLAYALLIGGMAWGTINYREKALNGFMSYGKAFGSCYLILLFASILLSVFMYVYIGFIDQHVMDKAMLQAEENMRNKGMDDAQIEMGMKYAKMFMTPVSVAIITFIAYQIIGTILSLLTAIFLRKDNPNPFGGVNTADTLDNVR